MSGFFGSTTTLQKYQPRPQIRCFVVGEFPGRAGIIGAVEAAGFRIARSRRRDSASLGATAMPMRPSTFSGQTICKLLPFVAAIGGFENAAARAVWQADKLTTADGAWPTARRKLFSDFCGSKSKSIAPTFSSLYRIFCHVAPPSVERNTPRSAFGP